MCVCTCVCVHIHTGTHMCTDIGAHVVMYERRSEDNLVWFSARIILSHLGTGSLKDLDFAMMDWPTCPVSAFLVQEL